jgi:3-hydroxy acid dehydrogenase / malonic semialdehyde reductase
MKKLDNKIVLITGASSGIGESCARLFASEGAKLILCARRLNRIEQTAKELKHKFGTESYTFKLDVRNEGDVMQTITALPAEWKDIDILINNAGLSRGLEKIHEGHTQDWNEMIDTNIKGLLYVSRAVIPGMIERSKGHIINLGSIAGTEVYPGGNVYCATKHAVRALSNGMRLDLVGSGIRVTNIQPGLVETEFSIVRFHGDDKKAKKTYENMTPLSPDDIADTALYTATLPPHVVVTELTVLPVMQASTTLVYRGQNKV